MLSLGYQGVNESEGCWAWTSSFPIALWLILQGLGAGIPKSGKGNPSKRPLSEEVATSGGYLMPGGYSRCLFHVGLFAVSFVFHRPILPWLHLALVIKSVHILLSFHLFSKDVLGCSFPDVYKASVFQSSLKQRFLRHRLIKSVLPNDVDKGYQVPPLILPHAFSITFPGPFAFRQCKNTSPRLLMESGSDIVVWHAQSVLRLTVASKQEPQYWLVNALCGGLRRCCWWTSNGCFWGAEPLRSADRWEGWGVYVLCPDLYLDFQLPIQGGSSLRLLMSPALFSLKRNTTGALLWDGAASTWVPVAQWVTPCRFPFVYQSLVLRVSTVGIWAPLEPTEERDFFKVRAVSRAFPISLCKLL